MILFICCSTMRLCFVVVKSSKLSFYEMDGLDLLSNNDFANEVV